MGGDQGHDHDSFGEKAGPSTPMRRGPTTASKNVVLTEAGKAPWYDANGRPLDAYIVGVAGGSGSGKTSVAKAILQSLPNVPWVGIVSQDSFYKSLTRVQSKMAFENNYNFDHPNAFDYDIFQQCIADLKKSRAVEIPVYSFVEHQRTKDKTYMYGATIIIVEGIFVLHDPALRSLLDLKIFVQADSDLMLARRIKRDLIERGRDVTGILDQYLRFVKPSMDNFVSQTSRHADIIVPGQNNDVAIDVISQQIKNQLESRAMKLRHELSRTPATPRREIASSPLERLDPTLAGTHEVPGQQNQQPEMLSVSGQLLAPRSAPANLRQTDFHKWPSSSPSSSISNAMIRDPSQQSVHPLEDELPPNVIVLPQTSQLRGLLTIMHDVTVTGEDFVFTVDRLSTLVMEAAMAVLPYQDKVVKLKGRGKEYAGTAMDVDHICSVSILRSGSVLEASARRAIPALARGSVLIQSSDDGEPKLYTVNLPSFVRNREKASRSWALVLDSQIGTGAAALMCIRVLLDHGVGEDHIVFCCLLASAKGGVHALHRAFPQVKVVTAGVDPELKRRRVPYKPVLDFDDRQTIGRVGRQSRMDPPREVDPQYDDVLNDDIEEERRAIATHEMRKSRVCFAIEPGAGNIGDRYFGTKVRTEVTSRHVTPQLSMHNIKINDVPYGSDR